MASGGKTFRIGLFGLDKLRDPARATSNPEPNRNPNPNPDPDPNPNPNPDPDPDPNQAVTTDNLKRAMEVALPGY